ncbi:hypothetical protein Ahy_A09g046315 [Arachis hypogaea]|uniref:DUF4283 domain-containing protein n=1 Tax=Arachis hypogaea TaxID=3818 RepID=A0A445BPF7_ARAHY|nr:hypothetical protein Ahy_A09g046315 [Arachis hypogaea]
MGFMEHRDWTKKGKINVINMDRDYFLVHFSDEVNYLHALMEGLWMIAEHYLIVQRCRPFFLSSKNGRSICPESLSLESRFSKASLR